MDQESHNLLPQKYENHGPKGSNSTYFSYTQVVKDPIDNYKGPKRAM